MEDKSPARNSSYMNMFRAGPIVVLCFGLSFDARAQSSSSSTSIGGIVVDPSGAVVPNASVEIRNPVSGFDRSTKTNNSGIFVFPNVPFNAYHLTVTAAGFAPYAQDTEVRSAVPVDVNISLSLAGASGAITVTAGDLLENSPIFHADIDRALFDKLPHESQSSSVSSLVTLTTPGSGRRFERPLSWTGRSRREFLFGRRPAHH
jgi:hypothetical protein